MVFRNIIYKQTVFNYMDDIKIKRIFFQRTFNYRDIKHRFQYQSKNAIVKYFDGKCMFYIFIEFL